MTLAARKALPAIATALTLISASVAHAAPAGDEYLPQEPSASGQKQSGGQPQATTATGSKDAPAAGAEKGKAKQGAKDEKQAGQGDDESTTTAAAASSDDDDSSGALDTLTDPVVLLLIAGVIIVAIGMTLRRRHGEEDGNGERPHRDPGSTPPTPDGEIVTGEQRP